MFVEFSDILVRVSGPAVWSSPAMRLVHDADTLAPLAGCILVPTMGALHEGHASLVRRAAGRGAPVVVTVFVNPTQFAPHEDFARYPRTLDADVEIARAAGADAVFAPPPEAIYPRGLEAARAEAAALALPDAATKPGLEDAFRPGHYGGVCQVVARLFDLARPARAIFGEKDWQQWRVLDGMVAADPARWPGLAMEVSPTVREPDGLAMSSRNRYLRPEQREQALGLVRALQVAASAQHPATAERLMRETLEDHGLAVDYAVVRDDRTLLPVGGFERPTRGLVAARLDTVRLIDTMALPVCR
jgi:pantoate--beta-alanine ligase